MNLLPNSLNTRYLTSMRNKAVYAPIIFPDPARGLAEFRRILRPGRSAAVCVISTADRAPMWGILCEVLSRFLPEQRAVLELSFALADVQQLEYLFARDGNLPSLHIFQPRIDPEIVEGFSSRCIRARRQCLFDAHHPQSFPYRVSWRPASEHVPSIGCNSATRAYNTSHLGHCLGRIRTKKITSAMVAASNRLSGKGSAIALP
jgi:hypothetical protein